MTDTPNPDPSDDVAQLIASLNDAPVFVAEGFPTEVESGSAGLTKSLNEVVETTERGESASKIGTLKIGYINQDGERHNNLRDVAQKVLDLSLIHI